MLKIIKIYGYYVLNFDFVIYDIEVWCEEVECVRILNYWSDYECFLWVFNCFKGDVKIWFSEWNINDWFWFNF